MQLEFFLRLQSGHTLKSVADQSKDICRQMFRFITTPPSPSYKFMQKIRSNILTITISLPNIPPQASCFIFLHEIKEINVSVDCFWISPWNSIASCLNSLCDSFINITSTSTVELFAGRMHKKNIILYVGTILNFQISNSSKMASFVPPPSLHGNFSHS